MKKILILGCTGSIGTNALDIVRSHPDRFMVVGLSAHLQSEKLQSLAVEFCTAETALTGITRKHFDGIRYYGEDGLKNLIRNTNADIVLNGISGASGLIPSIEVLNRGIDLALANKETIVMAGPLIHNLSLKKQCQILPVDSEHSAVFNLIKKFGSDSIDSVILTASGGPFRLLPRKQLAEVTAEDALKHPTWNMGKKITIDSATLANKGLEVIEACRLFNMSSDHIQVTIHPQSLVHSLIRTKDGVLYAQISKPDMKHPILSAFNWPDFLPNTLKTLDFLSPLDITFTPPRYDDFPMLSIAYKAVDLKGKYTIAYNGANELAVDAFIKGRIRFTEISAVTAAVMEKDWSGEPENFDSVYIADKMARSAAEEAIIHFSQN